MLLTKCCSIVPEKIIRGRDTVDVQQAQGQISTGITPAPASNPKMVTPATFSGTQAGLSTFVTPTAGGAATADSSAADAAIKELFGAFESIKAKIPAICPELESLQARNHCKG